MTSHEWKNWTYKMVIEFLSLNGFIEIHRKGGSHYVTFYSEKLNASVTPCRPHQKEIPKWTMQNLAENSNIPKREWALYKKDPKNYKKIKKSNPAL